MKLYDLSLTCKLWKFTESPKIRIRDTMLKGEVYLIVLNTSDPNWEANLRYHYGRTKNFRTDHENATVIGIGNNFSENDSDYSNLVLFYFYMKN